MEKVPTAARIDQLLALAFGPPRHRLVQAASREASVRAKQRDQPFGSPSPEPMKQALGPSHESRQTWLAISRRVAVSRGESDHRGHLSGGV